MSQRSEIHLRLAADLNESPSRAAAEIRIRIEVSPVEVGADRDARPQLQGVEETFVAKSAGLPDDAEAPSPRFVPGEHCGNAKRQFQIRLLDEERVSNGIKAISIWLHQNWTAELEACWGSYSNPSTIKGWRSQLRRGRRSD